MVESLPPNEGDKGSFPGTRVHSLVQEDPRALEQLSLRAASTESQCCDCKSLCAESLCSATGAAIAVGSKGTAVKSGPGPQQ